MHPWRLARLIGYLVGAKPANDVHAKFIQAYIVIGQEVSTYVSLLPGAEAVPTFTVSPM